MHKFPRLIQSSTVNPNPQTGKPSAKPGKVTNSRDNGGVSNVNSDNIRCFGGGATTPGKSHRHRYRWVDTLGFNVASSGGIVHFGRPCQFYMARVPDDKDINTWEPQGTGNVWFKVGSISAVLSSGEGKIRKGDEGTWPAYLESIALQLHLAQNPGGGSQFYLFCGQVKVVGGGSGVPGPPLVSFPGAYKANDAGLIWPNSPARTSYTAPGPAVWE
ncbi:hypothetical protein QBC35DRAFT_452026 [Podospora australis]|uniref:lytic cellulose monooxygenase (C4-dehydrogenating) n=1 Tax=Podospora australis TaxID=1536484 RepID=A0AAN6WTM4_9PEZI|nr:hypothetical protein QBC35DRAFT_452026 [Podospora australis]